MGGGMLFCALAGLLLFDRRTLKRHGIWLILAVVIGAIVMQWLKYEVARPRPLIEFAPLLEQGERHIHVVGKALQHRSFPSGHAQSAASVFTYLWFLYPRYGGWWAVGMFLAALGRVYVGVHFPADVLAGTCIGALSAFLVMSLQNLWHHANDSYAKDA